MLEDLERGNLFVVSLDDKRTWYRYHHLFADVLMARSLEKHPDQQLVLHQRASAWYEQNNSPAGAIRHALAAKDFERAAGLIELAWPAMDASFQSATWLRWVQVLPKEMILVRPVLCLGIAWSYLNEGELETAEAHLQNAEQWLKTVDDTNEKLEVHSEEMVVVDKKQFQFLPASIATARAYQAQSLGDVTGNVKFARQALDLLPKEDHLMRGVSASLLGLAYWANGDLEEAYLMLSDGMARFRKGGNMVFSLSGTFGLADIRIAQGRLLDAFQTYEQALEVAGKQSDPVFLGTPDMYLGLSKLYCEQGDLELAKLYLQKSEKLGAHIALPDWPHRFHLAKARLREVQGDLDGALDLLREAERLYFRSPIPNARPVSALITRIWIKQGKLTKAMALISERKIFVDDNLSYLREFEHITLARVLLARYRKEHVDSFMIDAKKLLNRLLKAAEKGNRMGSVIEILLLQAIAYEAENNRSLAIETIKRTLTLAEPEGYVQIFVDEGVLVKRLLSVAGKQGILSTYTNKLLQVWNDDGQQSGDKIQLPTSPLIEPLSEREMEVLGLINQGLSNKEISERLFVSLSTVKGHNQNIFGKLQVQRRTEAVARARELGLL